MSNLLKKFDEVYNSIILEGTKANKIKAATGSGKITDSSKFEGVGENHLFGKSYSELKKMAAEGFRNKGDEVGSTCTCPVCGKRFTKQGGSQWCHGGLGGHLEKSSKGEGLLKRRCITMWADMKKQLKKDYPESAQLIQKELSI